MEQTYEELKDEVIFQLQQSDKIELDGRVGGQRLICNLKLDMISDDQILFQVPFDDENEPVDISNLDKKPNFYIKSSDGYKYSFSCKIRKFTDAGFSIKFPKSIQKDAMRNDVRIDVNIGIKYRVDPESAVLNFSADTNKKYNAAITNISAGGGFIITKERLFFKNFLIKVEIGEKELSFLKNVTAKIVRVKKLRGDKQYGLAFMFINMYSKDKERLIKWIFQVQLEQQQKQKERLAER